MDDLTSEFLAETSESLETAEDQLVRFERELNDVNMLDARLADGPQ